MFVSGLVADTDAQTNDPKLPDPPRSMGQPKRLRTAFGLEGGRGSGGVGIGRLFANLTPEGLMPNIGIDLMSLEGGLSYANDEWAGDVGYFVRVPWVRTGVTYDFRGGGGFSWVFSLQFSGWRGGVFRHGEELRFDYWSRGSLLMAGLVFNAAGGWDYRRTRPIHKTVEIPKGDIPPTGVAFENGLPGGLEQTVQEIEHSIEWLDKLLTPRFYNDNIEERADEYRTHIRTAGHTFIDEGQRYHGELRSAFALAVGGDDVTGKQIGTKAEEIIYRQILVPYNGYFGYGKDPKHPDGYAVKAIEEFDRYLQQHSRFSVLDSAAASNQRALSREVFRRTVAGIRKASDAARARWKTSKAFWSQDNRLTWLPLNYGLMPDQYDTQTEWDAITEEITGHEFTRANRVEYLVNERFHYELKRMINDTESYHVLLIHDFQGRHPDGGTDSMGWEMVADGYMRALIDAVKAIDAGEHDRLPQFLIFIDQNFYQANKSRQIITYLEKLYESNEIDLKDKEIQSHVEKTHQELIDAIHASPTYKDLDEKTLKKLFKIHISVTNPWDPSFALDIDKRDHRKLAFRDIVESDPARGEGMLTGTGIGQHYHPPGWEDRAMLVQGPALIDLKRLAKRLCLSQDYEEDEIPVYLQDRPFPADYEDKLQALREKGWQSNVMIVANDTGYGNKKATVQRAVMYNLAPKASVLMAIDSLWLSDFWAAMYIAAALRGSHVYAVAPSPANAPASANFVMFLMRENLMLLVGASGYFKEDLDRVGGEIHVGLYDHDFGSADPVARTSAVLKGLEETPFLVEDFPFHSGVVNELRDYLAYWQKQSTVPNSEASTEGDDNTEKPTPFVHMKTQFFATNTAMKILQQKEWVSIVRRFGEIRSKQYLGEATEGMTGRALVNFDEARGTYPLVAEFESWLEENRPRERSNAIYAFTIGSFNQDRRGMLSDGEVIAVCGGYTALIGVLDMYTMAATSAWPTTEEELGTLFPETNMSTRMKRISRYLQDFF